MCYTEIKLGNKTNKKQALTNKNKNIKNKKEQEMAANPNKISTYSIPGDGEVIDSDWKDDVPREEDIKVDYAIYGDNEKKEGEYISPTEVSKESIKRIKGRQIRLAIGGLQRFRQKEQKELAHAA